jgi:hypothetical protein
VIGTKSNRYSMRELSFKNANVITKSISLVRFQSSLHVLVLALYLLTLCNRACLESKCLLCCHSYADSPHQKKQFVMCFYFVNRGSYSVIFHA